MTESPQARWRQLAYDMPSESRTDKYYDALYEAADLVDKLGETVERQRCLIHDPQTICDPSGMVQTIASLTEQRDALLIVKAERDRLRKALSYASSLFSKPEIHDLATCFSVYQAYLDAMEELK